jgi:hypothetical protein
VPSGHATVQTRSVRGSSQTPSRCKRLCGCPLLGEVQRVAVELTEEGAKPIALLARCCGAGAPSALGERPGAAGRVCQRRDRSQSARAVSSAAS